MHTKLQTYSFNLTSRIISITTQSSALQHNITENTRPTRGKHENYIIRSIILHSSKASKTSFFSKKKYHITAVNFIDSGMYQIAKICFRKSCSKVGCVLNLRVSYIRSNRVIITGKVLWTPTTRLRIHLSPQHFLETCWTIKEYYSLRLGSNARSFCVKSVCFKNKTAFIFCV